MKIFGGRACRRALRTLHAVRGSHDVTDVMDESAQRSGARRRVFLGVTGRPSEGSPHFSKNDIMHIIGNR